MTITNGYTTLATFKAHILVESSDTSLDTLIEMYIEAASRAIDDLTGRRFWVDGSDVVRYYQAANPARVYIDDLVSLSSLLTDDDGDGVYETTWTTSDYWLQPVNNAPYTWIERKPYGDYSFPVTYPNGVKITGKFGWPAVPKPIVSATILLTNRLLQRRTAWAGMVGGTELQAAAKIPVEDPDVVALVKPYVRGWFAI